MVLGSEGRLGVITEATVHVHRVPERRVILGYLFPDWADAPRGDARHRRERGGAVGHARVGRQRDAVLVRHQEGRHVARPRQVHGAHDVPAAAHAATTSAHVPVVHRLRGRRGARRARSASSSGEIVVAPRRHVHRGAARASSTTRRSSTRPYIRDYLLDRGALGRRVRDRGAVERAAHALRRRDRGRARRLRRARRAAARIMCHLSHSYHSGACLYFTFALQARGRARDALEQYDVVKSRDPAGVHGLGRPRSRTTTRSASSTRRGWSRTSRRRASRWCARSSTAWTRAPT